MPPSSGSKTAIVTGASSGIGKSIVIKFSEVGAQVHLLDSTDDTSAFLQDAFLRAGGNMTSFSATVGIPDRFAYSMTKGPVHMMTYSVALDYVKDRNRCNSISPGRVHTPFVDSYLAKNYPGREKEMFQNLSKTQPIGRMATPEEIAGLAT